MARRSRTARRLEEIVGTLIEVIRKQEEAIRTKIGFKPK